MRGILSAACLLGVGCTGSGSKTDSSTVAACELAEASASCPECSDGPTRCDFDRTAVVVSSCGECQARWALYDQLCRDGETATAAEIEAETRCEPDRCIVIQSCICTYDCMLKSEEPDTTVCSDPCTEPFDPPSACVWNGAECAWE